jgi:membrane protease YdiL (CAAX protease family)
MFLTAVLLGLAICAVWIPQIQTRWGSVQAWTLLLSAALVVAFAQSLIDWRGVTAVAGASLLAYASKRAESATTRRISKVAAVIICFALGIQLLPGFTPFVFVERAVVSQHAAPIHVTARLDAGIAGLLLLAFYSRRLHSFSEARNVLVPTLAVTITTTVIVMAIAVAAGYIALDLKAPPITVWHLLKILLWTCVLEEALFRGVIQEALSNAEFIRSRPSLRWLPIAVSSVVFGLAHAPGGAAIAILATIAGIGYSMAYALARRIEAAITVHFVVNAVHFLAFTYPFLIKAK